MMRIMFVGKIHRATVTNADLNYEGSITIDENLMEKANMYENEKVCVWDIDNGNRLETYAIKGKRGSGIICLNGAAARKVSVGDKVIIASFAMMDEKEAKSHKPNVVLVDEKNRITQVKKEENATHKPNLWINE
ncbi:MAG: aspartate 1-decarboxylase [Campylobacterota bacterium]|nr:aspartate 1-decarboxylase [Campylobacterota bacterium]